MISVFVPVGMAFDDKENIFHYVKKDTTIQLEHSLISVQKWESKWQKPFLSKGRKTTEETVDYIKCMCVTQNVDDDVFYCIPAKEMLRIAEYIESPMTATRFVEDIRNKNKPVQQRGSKEPLTAEIIYYQMISLGIPSEYRKWHLNQLLTLIRVFNVKNAPKDKQRRSRREILEEYQRINEENKKRFNTRG